MSIVSTSHGSSIQGSVLGTRATLRLYADADLYTGCSFTSIEGLRGYGWSLSGPTIGMSLSNESSYGSYRPVNSGEITISGYVDVDYYLIVGGVIKMMTETYRAGYNYSITNRYTNTYINRI